MACCAISAHYNSRRSLTILRRASTFLSQRGRGFLDKAVPRVQQGVEDVMKDQGQKGKRLRSMVPKAKRGIICYF